MQTYICQKKWPLGRETLMKAYISRRATARCAAVVSVVICGTVA